METTTVSDATSIPWYAPITIVLFPLALAWLIFIGSAIATTRVRQTRFAVTTSDDRWIDITSDAEAFRQRSRRVRTGRVVQLTGALLLLWSAYLVSRPLSLGYLLTAAAAALMIRIGRHYLSFVVMVVFGIVFAVHDDDATWQGLFVTALGVWIYVAGRRSVRRKYPSYRRGVDAPIMDDWLARFDMRWSRRRVGAAAVSALVGIGFVLVVYTYVAAKWTAVVAPHDAVGLRHEARQLPLGHIRYWADLVVALDRSWFGTAEVALLAAGAGLFLLNGLALRLWTPDMLEVLAPGERPEAIVYLRNFGDDEVTLRSGSYSRSPLLQVVFDVLVPIRRRPFEQVLSGLLRRFGPVIGAANPHDRLRRGGALKTALPHAIWRDEVKGWCESATAVVMSATPTAVNDGLREELRILSEELTHERIILVLGPGERDDISERFARFKAALPSDSSLLDDIDHVRVSSGTLVMVRVPGHGWDCWGASYRTEAAYAVALDQAIHYGMGVWALEPAARIVVTRDDPARHEWASSDVRTTSAQTTDGSVTSVRTGTRDDDLPIDRTGTIVPLADRHTPSGVGIVPGRLEPRRCFPLGMYCTDEGHPRPLSQAEVLGRWEAGADLRGIPQWRGSESGRLPASAEIAVTTSHVYAIVGRFGIDEEVWISLPRTSLAVRGVGTQGLVWRRPQLVEISGDGWTLALRDVAAVRLASDTRSPWEERKLLRVLSAASSDTAADMPMADPTHGEWTPTGPTEVFVQTIDGARSGATCLVDPRSPVEVQSAYVGSLRWLPANIRDDEVRRVDAGIMPRMSEPGPDLLHSPCRYPTLAITGPSQAIEEPLRGYLWPRLDTDLAPMLEPGETVVLAWQGERPNWYTVSDDLRSTFPWFRLIPDEVATTVAMTITDRRVILVTTGRSRASAGVLHVRFEWICGLNIERYTYLDGKPPTMLMNIVSGQPAGERFALWLNWGKGKDPASEHILDAIRYALTGFGLTIAPAQRRVSDNGRKGMLTWEFHAVNGSGLSVPAALIDR